MDHRIAKDMISSGMIPSGEKKKEDLGRSQYGSAPSPNKLMDAYKSMYDKKEEVINEHHQKDKDGNTIPHEDEEIKESGDVFDTVVNHFLNEGYQREDIIKAMSTVHLTEEQLLQEDFGISALIAGTAAALAKGAAVAGKVAAVGGKVAGAAAKGGMAAAKGIGTATKGIVSAAKPVASAATKGVSQVGTNISKGVSKAGTKIADTTKNVSQQVKNVATQTKDKVGQKIQDIAKPQSNPTTQTPQQKTVKDRVIEFGKKKGEEELRKDRPVGKTNKTGVAHAGQTDIAASADLFDIVKGRLLDEGLSEEEIKDIMLSLTPDEIMEELSDTVKRNDALNKERAMQAAQDRKVPENVRAAQRRQNTAGGPKDTGENKYTTQDKKTIIDYHKNK